MGISRHLALEELSALADGELAPATLRAAREHVFECADCRGVLEMFTQVTRDLQLPPAMSCASARELISARIDSQADDAQGAAAMRHLGACAACRAEAASWRSLDAALRSLPAGSPSLRVDRAIDALGRGAGGGALVPGFIGRGLITGTAAIAILLAGLSRGAAPNIPVAVPDQSTAVVAAIQEIVFNSRTGTLYVLDTPGAAVDVRDANTNELKTRIEVGGRPTALALNESTNTVLVLDSQQKKVTEIDGSTNKVKGSALVALSGTPTSIGVDPSSSKIVVTTTGDGPKDTTGSVAVIDSDTKQVESVREVTVSAKFVVFDPAHGRAALVSPDATTIVDESYKPIETLAGGVSAAFTQGDDRLAVLSADGKSSLITFTGGRTKLRAVSLPGTPKTIASLPDGGYLVLVDLNGRGRVSYLAPDGHEAGNVDLAITGRDLTYDPIAKKFTVTSGGEVVSASVPEGIGAGATVATTTQAPATSAPASAAPTSSAAPSASASPSTSPSPSPSVTATPNPLDNAATVATNLRRIDLPDGRQPLLVSKSGERLWILDQRNGIDTVDLSTGEIFTITSLPNGAQATYFVAGRKYAYALDAQFGQLHIVNAVNERVRSVSLNFLKPVSAVAVGIDDRLWIGLVGAPYLLAFDPKNDHMDTFDLGPARVSALTVDGAGRILYADDARGTVGVYEPTTGTLSEVAFVRRSATTSLLVDRSSTLWLATATGEIYSVRGGAVRLVFGLTRPVTALAIDSAGHAWYLAPAPPGVTGSVYGSLDGTGRSGTLAGPASSLAFSALGNAWLADPAGHLFVAEGIR